MERRIAYGAGYQGRRPEELLDLAERRDLVVVDVRLSPRSRSPGWNRGRLGALLGGRYRHLPEWGNTRYRAGPPVAIADLAAGLAVVAALDRPPLLLCVCADPAACHRSVLGGALTAHGWQVSELAWDRDGDSPGGQLALPLGAEGGTRHG